MTIGDLERAGTAHARVLRRAFDALPVQIHAWTRDLRVLFANAAALEWSGLCLEDVLGRSFADTITCDVGEFVRPYFQGALDGHAVRYERVVSDEGGVRRSFVVDVAPLVVAGVAVGVRSVGIETSRADPAGARVGARSPLLAERDRIGDELESTVLPRLRTVMRQLADVPWQPGDRDVGRLAAITSDIDTAVAEIRDSIRELQHSAAPATLTLSGRLDPPRSALAEVTEEQVETEDWGIGHLLALFESLPPTGVWDAHLRNVAINRRAARAFGFSDPADIVGRHYRSVAGDAFADANEQSMRAALAAGPVELDLRFADSEGRLHGGNLRYAGFDAADGPRMVAAMLADPRNSLDLDLDDPALGAADLAADRRRIAEDLHDHVIQLLYAAGLSVDSVARRPDAENGGASLTNAVQCVAEAILAIDSLAGRLTRTDLEETEETVRRVVRRSVGALGFEPRLDFVGDPTALPSDVVADLTAVLREALSNVARHADADDVHVALVSTPVEARLRVCDDGVGIGQTVRSSGLANMASRALRHGGSFSAGAHEPRGTAVDWCVPL